MTNKKDIFEIVLEQMAETSRCVPIIGFASPLHNDPRGHNLVPGSGKGSFGYYYCDDCGAVFHAEFVEREIHVIYDESGKEYSFRD